MLKSGNVTKLTLRVLDHRWTIFVVTTVFFDLLRDNFIASSSSLVTVTASTPSLAAARAVCNEK